MIEQILQLLFKLSDRMDVIEVKLEQALEEREAYLDLNESAEFLSVSPNTMRMLLVKGRIPGRKFGRAWKIKKSDLLKMQSNEQ